MGVLDIFDPQKRFEKRMKKMDREVLLKMLDNNNQFRFNLGLINNVALTNKERAFTRTLAENAVWVAGVPEELEYFYKTTFPSLMGYQNAQIANTYFWHKVSSKTPRVHSGIPGLISRTMVTLLAGPGFDYNVQEKTEVDGEVVFTTNDEDTQRLFEIVEDNKFEDVLFPNAVLAESYGGYVGFKISHDEDITDFPILEVAIPETVEVITARGRQQGVLFKHYFEQDGKRLELHELYSTDENGDATVTYQLYENKGSKLEKLPTEQEDLTLKGLKVIPAMVKNNTTANTQFLGSQYGLSDYNNSQSLFNALDENLSQEMTVIRFNRPKRFFSDDLTKQNANGSDSTFDDFEVDYEMVRGDPDEKTNQYQTFPTEFDIENYTEADKQLLQKILTNSGLNAKTVGIMDFEAINSSDESQRGKETTSLRTRAMKLKLWRKTLEELFNRILQFDDVINGRETKDYSVDITFNDYVVPSLEQRIKTGIEALNGGAIDVKGMVDMIYLDDLNEERKAELVTNIKIENGVPLTEAPENIEELVE